MFKLLKGLFNTVLTLGLLLVILGVIIAGFLGYLPFLSKYIPAFRPVDLGVTSSQEEFNQLINNLGYKIYAPADYRRANFKDYTFIHSGKKNLKTTFTESQLSSILNYHPFLPFIEDAQVKIHQDGTVEYASKFILENLELINHCDPPVWTGLSPVLEQAKKRVPTVLQKGVPVYIRAKPEYTKARIQLNVEDIKLGKIPLPLNYFIENGQPDLWTTLSPDLFSSVEVVYAQADLEETIRKYYFDEKNRKIIDDFITNELHKLPYFVIKMISFKDGKLDFEGTISTVLKIVKRGF